MRLPVISDSAPRNITSSRRFTVTRLGANNLSMARPSKYSDGILDAICNRISDGETLAAICADPKMPTARTFLRWADENDEVAAEYSRALKVRSEWALAEHERIRLTAKDKDSASAARVQLSALEWQMSKMHPKRYGDASLLKLGDPDGQPFRELTATDRAVRLASILAEIERRTDK